MLTGLDTNITIRAKYDLAAIAKYAALKQEKGDPKCYEKYMILFDRISNLVYAIDSSSYNDLSNEDQLCLYHRLFTLLQTNSNIPGFINPNTDTTLDGIGYMYISFGNGNLFTIT